MLMNGEKRMLISFEALKLGNLAYKFSKVIFQRRYVSWEKLPKIRQN